MLKSVYRCAGRTYKFYTGTPVLPYGYGLSYTTWTYTPVNPPAKVSLAPVTAGLAAGAARGLTASIPQELREFAVNYWINVTNTGSVDADDVVLGFLVPPGAGELGRCVVRSALTFSVCVKHG